MTPGTAARTFPLARVLLLTVLAMSASGAEDDAVSRFKALLSTPPTFVEAVIKQEYGDGKCWAPGGRSS